MSEDPMIQVLTFVALILGIGLPLIFPNDIRKLISLSIVLLLIGFMSFTLLVIMQSSGTLYIFYFSMFTWMTGFILIIHSVIQKIRRSK